MPDYSIPALPAKRLRYFNNQFLIEQDFIDEQAHHIARSQLHMRSLCVAGVLEGMVVTIASGKLAVSAGAAVDSNGQLIVLAEAPTTLPDPASLSPGDYLLCVRFHENETDTAPENGPGTSGETRFTSVPAFSAIAAGTAPPSGSVVLGTFTVTGDAITAVTTAGRQYSGLRLPGPADGLSLAALPDGGLTLNGSLSVRAPTPGPALRVVDNAGTELVAVEGPSGALRVRGALSVQGTSTFASATVDAALVVKGTSTLQNATVGNDLSVDGSAAIRGALNVDGSSTLGKATVTGELAAPGGIRLADSTLWLRPDANHGIAWRAKWPVNEDVDGPVVFGFGGGALGTTAGSARAALTWRSNGDVTIRGRLQVNGGATLRGSTTITDLLEVQAGELPANTAAIKGKSTQFGVWGEGSDIGVYAVNPQSKYKAYLAAPGAAGDFYGPVVVNGSFVVTGSPKNFAIEHPIDPARYLVHAALEGPEAGVYYRGEARLADGICEVRLPHYFEKLVAREGRTIQLTPKLDGTNEVSALAAGPIENGRFVVRAIDRRNPAQPFYWYVSGIRRDIPPLVVEPLKDDMPALKGSSAHVYGDDAENKP